jgi:Xaa-Pro aminopeptidase
MAWRTLERTSAPRFPEHPESEHRWRLERARRMIREDRLDALMLSRNVNVFYMTGSRFVFVDRDGPTAGVPQTIAIVTRDADIYCQRFGPFDTEDVPRETTWSQTLVLYQDELELLEILKHHGVPKGARIGVEWGPSLCTGINPLRFQLLQQRLQEELSAEIVDSTTTVWKVTAVKSALEIERMRVAVGVAARALDRIIKWVEIGMNELDVARMAQQFMLEEGGDGVSHAQVMGMPDNSGRFGSCNALDRRIERGWVNLDIGAKYRRYASDINRGTFLGRGPTPDEEKLYACRIGANAVLDRTIKPGVSIDDAVFSMKAYVEAQGCTIAENRGGLFGGHAIGLEHYQRPSLAPSISMPELQNADGKVLFEPGMMFTYEMPVRLEGCRAAFNVEDDVVVTATGVENMSAMLSREMQVKL